ncbi:hypothetical protein HYY75_01575, partial [bacterium]|nr:hypothetical protein [bacterium]
CFQCLRDEAPHDFKRWLGESYDSAREKIISIRDPKVSEQIIQEIQRWKLEIQERNKCDSDYELSQKRRFIEDLGRLRPFQKNRDLNEFAKEAIQKYFPALNGTDYSENPAKSLSYFLTLDGIGFIKNVKCIRGPFGEPMTLLEAYEQFSRTEPQKAEEMLEIINDMRKLANPENEKERLPALLDGISRTLRLLQKK